MNVSAIAILTAICLLLARPAHAYVDPGTGGMLIQLITGGVAGLGVLLRLYWRRLRGALTIAGARAGEPASGDQRTRDPGSRG